MYFAVIGGLLHLMLLVGESFAQQTGTPRRNVVATARVIELAASSSSLSRPVLLRGTSTGLLVVDGGDNVVKLFDVEGRRVRTIGRRGAGPGEYREVMDVQVSASGRIVLADPQNGRVSWFDASGNFLDSFGPGRWVYRVLPINDSALAIASAGDSMLVEHVTGRRRKAFALPSGYGFLDSLGIAGSLEGITSPDGSVFLVFTYSGLLGRLRADSRAVELYPGVASAPWPRDIVTRKRLPNGRDATFRQLPPEIRRVSASIAADRQRVAILTFEAQARSRHVDVYDARTMAYACSIRVPERVEDLAFSGRRLFGRVDDPEPTLIRIEATPTAGTAPLCSF